MVWPQQSMVIFWEGSANCRYTRCSQTEPSQKEVLVVSRGKSPSLKGNPKFLRRLSLSFFYDHHRPYHARCSNLALFRSNLLYLGRYVHFLGINAINSISHNRSMKKCTKTVWKIMFVVFINFSCLSRRMRWGFKDMCGKSRPRTCRLLFFRL